MKKWVGIFSIIICILISSKDYADTFFSDIWEHWAEETIMWAVNDVPLFSGYEDGTFRPNESITNAEFIAIIYRAAEKQKIVNSSGLFEFKKTGESKNINSYKDITSNHWAYSEIKNVINYSNTNPKSIKFEEIYKGDRLYPNEFITREKAILLASYFVGNPISSKTLNFEDLSNTHTNYDTLNKVIQNGIISGYDNKIYLNKKITRAEAATIIKRVYYEMSLMQKKALKTLKYNENVYDDKYVYFGDYLSKNSKFKTDQDFQYARAINTLEYLTIIKTIPYKEREFYDKEPLVTLKKLKEKKYWNVVGLNYYLLKYNVVVTDKVVDEYLEGIVKSVQKRTDLIDSEYKMLVNMYIKKYKKQNARASQLLELWERVAKAEEEKMDILFLKTSILDSNKQYDTALSLYNKVVAGNINDLKIRMNFINNKGYIQMKLNRKTECKKFLNAQWIKVKEHKNYSTNSKYYDDLFKAMLKTANN